MVLCLETLGGRKAWRGVVQALIRGMEQPFIHTVLRLLTQLLWHGRKKSIASKLIYLLDVRKHRSSIRECSVGCFHADIEQACSADVIQRVVKTLAGFPFKGKDLVAIL